MPLADTKEKGLLIPSWRRGFQLWGTEVEAVTLPSWVVQHRLSRVEAGESKSAASGQVGGLLANARLLSAHAGCRPDSPRETLSVDVGQALLDPLHLARNRGQHPIPASVP